MFGLRMEGIVLVVSGALAYVVVGMTCCAKKAASVQRNLWFKTIVGMRQAGDINRVAVLVRTECRQCPCSLQLSKWL